MSIGRFPEMGSCSSESGRGEKKGLQRGFVEEKGSVIILIMVIVPWDIQMSNIEL